MSGQLLAHTRYKESEVDWIGTVPEHWQLLPARVAVTDVAEKNEGARNQDYLSLVAGRGVIPYADKGDIGNKKPDDLSKCKIVRKGNIVINSMNFFIGSYGMSEYEGVCSPVYIVLDVNQSAMERRFALRVFGDTGFQLYLATFGDGILKHRAAIGWDDIKGTYLPVPPISEQTQIAKFLDYETAKIDALIEKQQQLIALLKEKRQAVISHAVTKGLNPDAPMRDSGVEWLGYVPAHWTVGKCGFYLGILSGFAFPSARFSNDENDVRLLRGINVAVSRIRWDETVRWRRTLGDGLDLYQMAKDDLVIGMDRPVIAEGVRVSKIGPDDLPCLLLQRVASLKMGKHLSSSYLMHLLSSNMFEAHFSPETTGVSVPHISPSQVTAFVIPIPPIEEQERIVGELDKQVRRIDTLVTRSTEAAELLQERRTALISAAVTGKIDVRAWKTPETAPEEEPA